MSPAEKTGQTHSAQQQYLLAQLTHAATCAVTGAVLVPLPCGQYLSLQSSIAKGEVQGMGGGRTVGVGCLRRQGMLGVVCIPPMVVISPVIAASCTAMLTKQR